MISTILKSLLAATVLLSLGSCLKDNDEHAAGTVNPLIPIYDLRHVHRGTTVSLTPELIYGSYGITGVVISDASSLNQPPGTFILQQSTATPNQLGPVISGIAVRMNEAGPLPAAGDSVSVELTGVTLERIEGTLTLTNVTAPQVRLLAQGRTAFVRPVVLGMVTADPGNYESTLVAVHADVEGAGTGFGGARALRDGTGSMNLITRSDALFASATLPANARFQGISGFYNASGADTAGAQHVIRLRNLRDTSFTSGSMYTGYPESFESPAPEAKASYNITTTQNNIDLATGNWKLQQAILAPTVLRDKFNQPGKQCVRMQQNLATSGLVQMNYDVTGGVGKVTVFYGKYYTDPTSTFRLEYSINGGTTWVVVSPAISSMPDQGSDQASFRLNIDVPVRFRLNKLGLGASSATVQNGRLCIEDFAIYHR